MTAGLDFADWLSPMLVKELRQGMRSRFFVTSFLILQAAMIFVAIIALGTSADSGSSSTVSGFFWTIISVPLILIMPMSGLGAVGNEKKANTLELISLTRLTARRIITGKWVAIIAQTILLVCAVLPYLVLRYFLGGINLTSELAVIGILFFVSAVLSGLAVGFSPQASRLSRALMVVVVVIGLQIVPALVFGTHGGSGWLLSRSGPAWQTFLCLGLFGVIALTLMIEFGASRIAPLAENHSSSRRVIALLVTAAVVAFGHRGPLAGSIWTCAIILLAPLCIGALCEPISQVTSVYRPFVKRGFLGRLAGRILYPGWPSGFVFTLLLLLAFFVVGYFNARTSTNVRWIWWAGVAVAGTLFFPIAIVRGFLPRTPRPFVFYVGTQIIFALLTVLGASFQAFKVGDFRPVLAIVPTCSLLMANSKAITESDFTMVFSGVSLITASSICLLLVRARQPWREIRALEARAGADLNLDDGAKPASAH